MQAAKQVLALDVGERRIGVALAHGVARLARPYVTLARSEATIEDIRTIIDQEQVGTVVIGLPRSLEGQETAQTKSVRDFARQLEVLPVTLAWQDEALTSVKAESELSQRRTSMDKADVDALAATYILEDYLQDHR